MVRKRTHSKLLKENDIFRLYKPLEEEKSVRDKDKKRIEENYEKELIEILKDKLGVSKFSDVIKKIETTNPYDNGYKPRSNYDSLIKDRMSLMNQDKVFNTFNYMVDGKKGNSLETMIQRHIMLSEEYNDVLGKPIFYEFPCNTKDDEAAKEKQGKVPIDLISYDEDKKIIYLIELKKCCGCRGCINNNLSESTELFIRGLMEVTTYYSFFVHLIDIYKKEVEEALNTVGNVNINFDEVEIRKMILAPKRLFDDVYTDELKDELKNVDCFTIDIINDDISDVLINEKEKVFKIKRYE